jgi:hypothetical protein
MHIRSGSAIRLNEPGSPSQLNVSTKSGSRHISDKLQSETNCRPRGGGGLETPEYYRNRAANVRLEAGLVRLPHLRDQFIRIAEQYEELAAMIEQDQKKQP